MKAKARRGIFQAFVSLEGHKLNRNSKVQVFGEFSRVEGVWLKKVLCPFVESLNVFGTTLTLKHGDRFKFIIDDGKQYLVSRRYKKETDRAGIENNVFRFHDRSAIQNQEVINSYHVKNQPVKRGSKSGFSFLTLDAETEITSVCSEKGETAQVSIFDDPDYASFQESLKTYYQGFRTSEEEICSEVAENETLLLESSPKILEFDGIKHESVELELFLNPLNTYDYFQTDLSPLSS